MRLTTALSISRPASRSRRPSRLYAIAEKGSQVGNEVSAAEMVAAAFESIEDAYKNRGKPRGLSTGFKDIDAKMGRLQPSDLVRHRWERPKWGRVSPRGRLYPRIFTRIAVPVIRCLRQRPFGRRG